MTICPCCGFKFTGTLTQGCEQCGARSVGEPLPKPAQELPSYGRALVLVLEWLTTCPGIYRPNDYRDGSTIVGFARPLVPILVVGAAGETAAWRLKWISIPVMFVTLFFGLKIYRSIRFSRIVSAASSMLDADCSHRQWSAY